MVLIIPHVVTLLPLLRSILVTLFPLLRSILVTMLLVLGLFTIFTLTFVFDALNEKKMITTQLIVNRLNALDPSPDLPLLDSIQPAEEPP